MFPAQFNEQPYGIEVDIKGDKKKKLKEENEDFYKLFY